MFFSATHYVAAVSGNQYDLISGLFGELIPFVRGTGAPAVNGMAAYTCNIDGAAQSIIRVEGTTAQGLSKFRAAPAIV